ncbi:MAG: TonB family protein [Acidobacteriia bacterium]|nr:TonB family protein [Terriglobia bacterium]
MSAAAVQSTVGAVRRCVPRHAIAIPVDLTVLRSGIPASIPGRSLDVGEGGLCAILAGELRPGDIVGVEFRLPHVNAPIRAKAAVRHQARLRCGIEFLGLSHEQKAAIRFWERRMAEEQPQIQLPFGAALPEASVSRPAAQQTARPRRSRMPRQLAWAALALFVVVGALGWWQWYHAWTELESHLPGQAAPAKAPETTVPPALMEQLITHKVDPVYPEAARRANIQGTVVLDAVIGADGTVVDLRPVSGPDALTPAALDAVKWWRFQPYRINGQPTQVRTTFAVEFRL